MKKWIAIGVLIAGVTAASMIAPHAWERLAYEDEFSPIHTANLLSVTDGHGKVIRSHTSTVWARAKRWDSGPGPPHRDAVEVRVDQNNGGLEVGQLRLVFHAPARAHKQENLYLDGHLFRTVTEPPWLDEDQIREIVTIYRQ